MVEVSKELFYAIIGPLERTDGSAHMSEYPEKILWTDVKIWENGNYREVARSETFLSRPYPHPMKYSVAEDLLEKFIIFDAVN